MFERKSNELRGEFCIIKCDRKAWQFVAIGVVVKELCQLLLHGLDGGNGISSAW